jgi:hypothetical protein
MKFYSILVAITIWLGVGLAAEDKDPGIGITLYDGYA